MQRRISCRRAFTLSDVLALVVVTITGAAVSAVALGGVEQPGAARAAARKIKDSSQLRGIIQAMVIWANNNNDLYPLPSPLDKNGNTVKGPDDAKDTSAHIMSLMVFNGSIPTDILVSTDEKNPSITQAADYSFADPPTAVKPALALWDPAFSVDFTAGKKGHLSYGHLQPRGKRRDRWANTFGAEEVVLTNRGPEIKSVAYDSDKSATVQLASPKSYTLSIHGDGKSWSGHAAFNDAHVDFADKKIADGSTFTSATAPYYRNKDRAKRLDTWCYEELDDPDAANNYVGIFTVAGSKPADFKAIWD